MFRKEQVLAIAQDASFLDTRISGNTAGQRTNLTEWIFERLTIPEGSKVLELCSGTGAQTLRLIELVGNTGEVTALDSSPKALEVLHKNVKSEWRGRLTLLESKIDELENALHGLQIHLPCFDLVFCAYGLYYSTDASHLLAEVKRWLNPEGRIIVIGPFGPNNFTLFKLLEDNGVKIPEYVRYTSGKFMFQEVIPWLAGHFGIINIHTLINHITWNSTDEIVRYWQNSTFYEAARLPDVESSLREHFHKSSEFVNEKWIMMIEATDVRI